MDDFRSIKVAKGKATVNVENPTGLEQIGKGAQGAVFRISKDRCVKIYAKQEYARSESKVLKIAQDSQIVPMLYEVGPNYIVMEYINGQPLKPYLQSQRSIPESVTKQLLFIFHEMKRLGFARIDANIRHFIITGQGVIKVIDHVNSFKKERSWPSLFFEGLAKLKLLNTFLNQVKKMDPELFLEWKNLWENRENKNDKKNKK